jgi:tetratricopeptide (TPR) repeat protein
MELIINDDSSETIIDKIINNDETPINKVTLCLNMIVKNESKNITRLFDSLLSLIDCYCICDTGSTDNTIDVITNYFLTKGISGKVIVEPFKNFSYNRNAALSACQGMSDYILLLDADMVVKIIDSNKVKDFKNSLTSYDSFSLFQGTETFFYKNIRIIKNNNMFKYVGVTHEYVETPPNCTMSTVTKDILFILDLGDGGCKQDKFERDIKLLTDDIQENNNIIRNTFYLANSYYDLEKYSEAIPLYQKRIELGGWIQEVWFSYYRMGICHQRLAQLPEAVYAWLNGYNCFPERLEGLYEVIKHYRVIGKYNLCKLYYDICKKVLDNSVNRDDYLFLDNSVYTYKLYFEYTIFAFYINIIKNIDYETVKVLNNSHDERELTCLFSNLKFYNRQLNQIHRYDYTDNLVLNINGV